MLHTRLGPGGQHYLPLRVGAEWRYWVTKTDTGTTHLKTTTVEAFEDAGGCKAGVMAFRVVTENGPDLTISWQEDRGDMVVRHREQSFIAGSTTMTSEECWEPHKLRLDQTDLHNNGVPWNEQYTETQTENGEPPTTTMRADWWKVEAAAEAVTVYGKIYSALKVSKVSKQGTGSSKMYWFARGYGKVKETGGQTEELVTVHMPPSP